MTVNRDTDQSLTDLEIRIFEAQEQGYPVEMTLGGQQEFPRGYLAADIVPWTAHASGVPSQDGETLFEALLADGNLRSAWAKARGQAARRRIRLRIDPAAVALHSLPWELLHEGPVMLSAQADTPFSRYLPIALPWSGPVEERPIRMLVVIANPADLEAKYDLAPVEVDVEREILKAALAEVGPDELMADFLEEPATPERLEEALRQGVPGGTPGYHILHFVGHGAFSARRGQAALYMQDEAGNAQRVLDDALVSMLARQGARPRLVSLVACQSATRSTSDAFLGLGPKLVRVGVPAVVAMQDVVTIETGRKFGAAFYSCLLEHGLVDLAANEARSTLLTAGRTDAAVPVLFMRLKSGQLWGPEADARGEVLGARNPRVFWSGLIRMIQQGRCVPIVGPRVRSRWLPDPKQIAHVWAEEHGYPFSNKDELTQVAQYLASNQGPDFPRYELVDSLLHGFSERLPEDLRPQGRFDLLTELIDKVDWRELSADDPNEVHNVLASLDLPLYLTTNFDGFLTKALEAQGKRPTREICPWNEWLDGLPSAFEENPNYEPTPQAPLVYHLFGSDQEVDSLVLTEDDHLDFLVRISAEMDRIPNYIWAALSTNSLVFLGYGLDDWGFRVIMRGLVATRQQRRRIKHVGVQLDPRDTSAKDVEASHNFLQQYLQDAEINVFSGTMEQFIAELREEWESAN